MRFGDYLVYEALRENNRALHALGQRQPLLGDSAVSEMGAVVQRLHAYWHLLRGSVPAADRRAARQRLQSIQRALACASERLTLSGTVELLASNAPSDKSRQAVQLLAHPSRGVVAEVVAADQIDIPGPRAVQGVVNYGIVAV